jgi:hypothetical protein
MLVDAPRAAPVWPERAELGDDALAELVARTREGEGGVRVQTLERSAPAGATDAELERRAAVATGLTGRELAPKHALFVVGSRATFGKSRIAVRRLRPTVDAACGLETRDRGDEVATRDVVRRRERLALGVVRELLGHCGAAERAAHDDAAEGARLASNLTSDV